MAAPLPSCVVCTRDYDHGAHLPKMLPCGHSLCLYCLGVLAAQPKPAALCKHWKETGTCKFGDKCRFSHDLQLQPAAAVEPKSLCRNWATTGSCKFGSVCHFSHGVDVAKPAPAPSLQCPVDRRPVELPKDGPAALPTNFALLETLPQKPAAAFPPSPHTQFSLQAGPAHPNRAAKPAGPAGPKKPKSVVQIDPQTGEKRFSKGPGKKQFRGKGVEMKAPPEKTAQLSDVLKFINTKQTTNNYNDRYNEPKLHRYHTLTRVGNVTTATARTDKPENVRVQTMTFNKPELFFCKAGYVPYDPDKMIDVKNGVPQEPIQICFDPDGTPLDPPRVLELPRAPTASKMRFQGGALLFFIEYPHSTGVHFQSVLVYQYDDTRGEMGEYVMDGQFSLQNNYINCAAVTKKYLIISYWPYDLEAVKQIIENNRQKMEWAKQLADQARIIADLKGAVMQRDQELLLLRQVEQQRKEEMVRLRKMEEESRQRALAAQADAERAWQQYQASLRARDPIHLYTRIGKKWVLVLDYHEGAFGLQVRGDALFIEYPENQQHEFEIIATSYHLKNEVTLKGLPVVPREKLCPFF